jgi:hypothetical protein
MQEPSYNHFDRIKEAIPRELDRALRVSSVLLPPRCYKCVSFGPIVSRPFNSSTRNKASLWIDNKPVRLSSVFARIHCNKSNTLLGALNIFARTKNPINRLIDTPNVKNFEKHPSKDGSPRQPELRTVFFVS